MRIECITHFAKRPLSWSSGFSLRRLRSTVLDTNLPRLKPELQPTFCFLHLSRVRYGITPMSTVVAVVILALGIFTIGLPALATAQEETAQEDSATEDPATVDPTVEEPVEEEDEPLPTIDKMELPSFERLMQGPPVDWLVLHTKKVIVVEPVFPRPGTLDDIDQRIKRLSRRAGDPAETDEAKRKRLDTYYLPLTLLEGEDREYRLHIKYIKEIVYFEDLMLRRVDQLLDVRQVRKAYELLVALEERQETWRGVVARRERLLFTEAVVQLDERNPQQALALLEALHERNATYNGLEVQFGIVADRLIGSAQGDSDPRAARYYLRRLARKYPNHRFVKEWTARLAQQTRELLDKAVASERSGQAEQALDFVETAARVWPELPEVLPIYNRLAGRYQRLRVGVVDLPGVHPAVAPVVLSAAEHRRRLLTQTSLFEPARFENKIVRYESRFFSDWEPTDLGHSVLFRLRPYRTPGESQPLVTAAGLAGALARRLDMRTAYYDARFAATVESLEVRSPFDLAVRFRQVPLRPEPLFAFPRPPLDKADSFEFASLQEDAASHRDAPLAASLAHDPGAHDPGAIDPGVSHAAATYPFELQLPGNERAVYRRTIPEPESASARHVAEVIEVKFESYDKAIQGLLRGEVTFLPSLPASSARRLALRNEFFTQHYALPTTHVLQFNPHSRTLSARTLRRALVYAINRPQILEEVFLHEAPGSLGRVTSAPFATTSYAYNRDKSVEPHKFDAALAFSLAKTAEKELAGKLPVLRLVCANEPLQLLAAGRIVQQWKAIGIEAKVTFAQAVVLSADGHDDWDILYRTETLAEPLVELWQFLALTTSTETGALEHLPMWLRKQLLDLDRVGDGKTAEDWLHRLHEQFWAEVHLIPLWEIDNILVYRKTIRGVPEHPVTSYQKIERWRVEPWFLREPPL